MAILWPLLLVALVGPVQAEEAWQKEWNRLSAQARKEGTVVVVGAPDPVMRNEIIPRFSSRFGIPVQFIAGNASQIAARIGIERSAGQYTADVYMGNPRSVAEILYPQKMIDPLRPMLIHPEVVKPSNWKPGKLWFVDPEERYVLRVFSSVNSILHINTQYVKREEVRATRDLLNPKWKGKIVTEDPMRGKGAFRAAKIYRELGEEFFTKLYVEQKPVFSGDRRQINDWLARGTYPICLTCRDEELMPLRKDGFQFLEIFELSDMKGDLGASPWVLTVFNRALHPGAARVFANWIVSKEALELYSRLHGAATLRADLDESFLRPEAIPRPQESYFDADDWAWLVTEQKKIMERVQKLIRGR